MYTERANPPNRALVLFTEEITNLGLTCKVDFVGKFPQTARCVLSDLNGRLVDLGNGKGLDLQTELSAKYEALEHYLSTQGSKLSGYCLENSYEELEPSLSEINKSVLPKYFTSREGRLLKTFWTPLLDYFDKSFFMLPYACINPDYVKQPFITDTLDYSTFSLASSNNGTAIGTTFEEAMVHALSEVIERDAFSIFLLKTFVRDSPAKVRVVDKNSLPYNLNSLVDIVEKDCNEKLLIIDISTDPNFSVFCATFTKQNQLLQPLGCGASLSPNYALERAVLEAVQTLHLYTDTMRLEDNQIVKKFEKWPKLQDCIKCDIKACIEKGHFTTVTFRDQSLLCMNIREVFSCILKFLAESKFHLYYGIHYQSTSGITCVRVEVPELEKFHLIRHGHLPVLKKRARSILMD